MVRKESYFKEKGAMDFKVIILVILAIPVAWALTKALTPTGEDIRHRISKRAQEDKHKKQQ